MTIITRVNVTDRVTESAVDGKIELNFFFSASPFLTIHVTILFPLRSRSRSKDRHKRSKDRRRSKEKTSRRERSRDRERFAD